MSSRSEKHNKKKSPLKRTLQIGSIILLVLILGAGGYFYHLYSSVKQTAGQMHESVTFKHNKPVPKLNIGQSSVNILLMGVDERPGDSGRSDTMIIVTLNPKTKSMQMISIPRDTRTEIVGRGTLDKINAAYAYGGEKMAVETVQQFANINIDYFVKVNMQGLSELVDAVGGVTVNNKFAFTDTNGGLYKYGYVWKKGIIHLDGPEALGYVRMRHADPNGDFGRNQRQRQVITAIVDKGKSVTSVTKINDVLNALGSNVKTNMTFADMKNLVTNYRDCRTTITNYEVQGTGTTINNIYYLVVPQSERQHVSKMIKDFYNAK